MGYLFHHDLKAYNTKYNLNTFVETGVWKGDGVAHALDVGYEKIYSIELLDQFYNGAVERFKNDENITIIKGNTLNEMPDLLFRIPLEHGILFWLDAHLPSHYLRGEYDHDTEFPLEKELKLIQTTRRNKEDVFIIDDLRIYEHGHSKTETIPVEFLITLISSIIYLMRHTT